MFGLSLYSYKHLTHQLHFKTIATFKAKKTGSSVQSAFDRQTSVQGLALTAIVSTRDLANMFLGR